MVLVLVAALPLLVTEEATAEFRRPQSGCGAKETKGVLLSVCGMVFACYRGASKGKRGDGRKEKKQRSSLYGTRCLLTP